MPAFYLSFPQDYPPKLHPRWFHADHDGYVTVIAEDAEEAKLFAQSHFGLDYSSIETADKFIPQMYPKGEIARVVGLLHAPIEQNYDRADGTAGRWIICSCTEDGAIVPAMWGTAGHGEKRKSP